MHGQIETISYLFSLPENTRLLQRHFILPFLHYATSSLQLESFNFLLTYPYSFKIEKEDIEPHLSYTIKVERFGVVELFKAILENTVTPINLIDNDYFYFKEMCEANAEDLIQYVICELNLEFNNHILQWLNGDNLYGTPYVYPLTLLNAKKLFQQLNEDLSVPNETKQKKKL